MKKCYDVFFTTQTGSFSIYSHKPERWAFDRAPVIAKETDTAIYYCSERDKIDVVKFLNRNAARANNK